MVRADPVHRAVEATGLDSPAARDAVNVVFKSMASALTRGERVVLRRFGVFHSRSPGRERRGIRAPTSRWVPAGPGGALPSRAGSPELPQRRLS